VIECEKKKESASTNAAVYTPIRKARLTGSLMRAWNLKGTSPSAIWLIGEAVLRGII
jgi:hypothetical protein